MCLIAFDYRPLEPVPLRLVANRDEFHGRESAALACWPDAPDIVGGRDLVAGGSWLAVHRRGRLAAVTNVRDPRLVAAPGAPSRGHLVREALECDDPQAWLDRLVAGEATAYAGFNLLVSDGRRLWHLHRGHRETALRRLPPGIHGLSNASLNTPWPKLALARQGLAQSLTANDWPWAALETMHTTRIVEDDRRLPNTGVGLDLERRLSPPFIVGDDYGTRSMTWLTWHAVGGIELGERRFGPNGKPLGETRLAVDTPPTQDA